MHPRPYHHRRAFTLLELLAVLAIMGILMGWAVLNVGSQRPGYEFDKENSRIASILRDARDRAILHGRTVRLEIAPVTMGPADTNLGERVVEYYYDEPAEGEDLLEFYENEEPFLVQAWNPDIILDGALVGSEEVYDFGEPVVLMFWANGLCTPARLYVYHRKRADDVKTIRLNALTGMTKIIRGREEAEVWELHVERKDSKR